jgi:predicted GIY-YIG superfamily endonuclease
MSPEALEHLRAFLEEVVIDAARIATEQLVSQRETPRYATAKSNPLGSARSFLNAHRAGKFRTFMRGREVAAIWKDVERWMSRCDALAPESESTQDATSDAELPEAHGIKKLCVHCGCYYGSEEEALGELLMLNTGHRPRATDGYIYFVRSAASGLVKIGFTASPETRMRGLEHSSGGEIEVLHQMRGTVAEERALHKQFASARRKGEWFEATDELIAHIEALKAQTTVEQQEAS